MNLREHPIIANKTLGLADETFDLAYKTFDLAGKTFDLAGMKGWLPCYVFALVIDFIGPLLKHIGHAYDLTGVWWSPIAATVFGWFADKRGGLTLPMKILERLGNLDARPEQRGISP